MSVETTSEVSRRNVLQGAALGFGWMACKSLLAADATNRRHHAPRAKRVIFLFMDGGVSHVDSFDPKPELTKHNGQDVGTRKATLRSQSMVPGRKWLGTPWTFANHGQSGLPISDLFPHIARSADDLCVVRSLVGDVPLHGAQNLLLHTGKLTGGAPSAGAWVSYGLGTENENLPGFVLLNNDWVPNGGLQLFSNSFLPAVHQACLLRGKGSPVDNIEPGDSADLQRAKLDLLAEQDGAFAAAAEAKGGPIESAIRNYETAFTMQRLIPELADVGRETVATLADYGVDRADPHQKYFALQCLRARRLIEAGVRFIEITCPLTHGNNSPWDQHGELRARHKENALITDQPIGALLRDLKARGLLDDTLVVWAGEMGRTPHSGGNDGRDHHVGGYSIWLAGGGVKGGMAYGATDELGVEAVENPLDVHDLHATMLHLLGVDHERLTFRFGGRDMRLTDVKGRVLRDWFA